MLLKPISSLKAGILTGSIKVNSVGSTIKKLSVYCSGKQFVQLCYAAPIASIDQVFFALEQTISAFDSGANFSKKQELEFLIRLTGRKQISRALDLTGLKKGMNTALLVIVASNEKEIKKIFNEIKMQTGFKEKKIDFKKNEKELIKIHGILQKEIDALKDLKNPVQELVLEKIALVALEN
ncbi:MAG: hypothetical protein J4224_04285 [Candidatus Diapherotrites archaeon]|uniref:Uncharacterized protein n=1 Tax=Candidatus Iainarchaeum sp. TaxID=3101447 RepID=A0A7J4ITG3_9ARCH|nr:MAG: DUF509 protein [archaeon GW2011_AR10]MBS3059614.1 hypothetical protein [Candidatus Diapherotrites archaeon]HIH08801.1 hypothetical protein [Candidatus Diapherotrites archaeon]